MTRIFLIGILSISLGYFKASAQSGFSAGEYYQQRYAISDVAVGPPYYKYNNYGQAVGLFQQWQYANWTSSSGGHYVYVWGSAGWQSVWYNGTYWWYNWVVYERRIQ